jgi:hypothetical protein
MAAWSSRGAPVTRWVTVFASRLTPLLSAGYEIVEERKTKTKRRDAEGKEERGEMVSDFA